VSTNRARVLRLAILGLLKDSPMHGYELRKRLNSELGAFRAFSYGSLYPCLKSLLAEGLIDEHAPVGSQRGRRSRISYQLTPLGEEHLERLLAETRPAVCDDECFGVHFAFFGHTRADVRLRILEGRRDQLEERLESFRALRGHPRRRTDRYTDELCRYGAESMEREVRWLSDLIRRERDQAGSAPGT
jgi:DNA-binding PadR family transcriptional regulator